MSLANQLLQKTNTSPKINGWKMHFNSPFFGRHVSFRGCNHCKGQVVKNCYSLRARGSNKKHLPTFGRFVTWESFEQPQRVPWRKMPWWSAWLSVCKWAPQICRLENMEVAAAIGLGEKSVCLQIHRSFQESQRLTSWKIHDEIQTVESLSWYLRVLLCCTDSHISEVKLRRIPILENRTTCIP